MDNYKRRTVELISNLALEYKGEPAVIPYSPQKTKISAYEKPSLKRSTPERHGISGETLYNMLASLEKEERANVHSIMVIKDREVICEASRPGYSQNCAHLSHSMSKSVIGMIIGMLFDDGKLDTDTPITDFFRGIPENDVKLSGVCIHHLLAMSSGCSFSEVGSVTESEWTRAALTSEPDFPPGDRFAYNSMNSYLLSAIASKTVREGYGITLMEFMDARLFHPLGIKNWHWEMSPEGIEKGGWGLYLSCESWAKIGIMIGRFGSYEGRRILSERWVRRSITTHSRVPPETGDFNYGYQIWVGREQEEILFNGMLGQNVWVLPSEGLVVSLNSGNNELFQQSPALSIIREHLTKSIIRTDKKHKIFPSLYEKERTFFAERRWITPHAPLHGLTYLLGLRSPLPFPDAFYKILGRYDLPKNNFGIMPFLVRLMQNNYQGGIESLTLTKKANLLRLTSTEGGTDYNIDFGFYDYVYNVLEVSGEKYMLFALADSTEDGEGNILYRLELLFPELPNTRRIILSLNEKLILNIKMTEIPDSKIADSFIASIPAVNPRIKLALELLEKNLGKNFVSIKLIEQFSPEICAPRTDSDIYEQHLAEERERFEKKVSSSRLVRSLITRFVAVTEGKIAPQKDGTDTDQSPTEGERPPGVGGLLWALISKLF